MITEINNTEIFELCENSSKQQRPECNTYWEIGVIYCSCGRNMKIFAETNRARKKSNYDVTSTLAMLSSRTAVAGPNTDLQKDKRMYLPSETDAQNGLSEKARKPPNDTCAMVRQRNLQRLVVGHRVARKRHDAIWLKSRGEAFLRRNKSSKL